MPTHLLENLSWLFHTPPPKNKGPSSCDTFNPISAASGDPWKSTTTPSAEPTKKTLILSADFIHGEIIDFFAIVEWLRRDGFEIRLCIFDPEKKENIFPIFHGRGDIEKLSRLAKLDKETDYDTLAQLHITRDQQVLLDGEKYAQLIDVLEKRHHIPHSSAIVSHTTIRFHAYPEIRDLQSLATHLRAAKNTQEAARLFAAHVYIVGIEDVDGKGFSACIAAYPDSVFMKAGKEIVRWRLIHLQKHAPVIAKKCIETYGYDIKDGYALAVYLSLYPEKTEGYIAEHGHKIEGFHQLATCLKEVSPLVAEKLIRMCGAQITGSSQLYRCAKACPPVSKALLKCYGYEIRDGFELAVHLRAYPEKIDILLEVHEGKIKNAEQLFACIEACLSHAETLTKKHMPKMRKDKMSLDTCTKAWHAGNAMLLKIYAHLISFDACIDLAQKHCLLERYFPSTLKRVYEMPIAPVIAEKECIENVHGFYIARVTERTTQEVMECMQQHVFHNIAVLEITYCTEEQIENLWKIIDAFPKEKALQVFLPKNIHKKAAILPKGFDYHPLQYAQYPLKDDPVSRESARAKKLYLASNGLPKAFGKENDGSDKSSFVMEPVGEVLNGEEGQAPLSVRAGVVDLDLENFTQDFRKPSVFLPVEVPLLDKKAFMRFCQEKSTVQSGRYAKFEKHISVGQKMRLQSIDAAEAFLAMCTQPFSAGACVKIERGKEDRFYYASTSQACKLEYVVHAKTQEELEALYADIPLDNPIKNIIESFKKNEKFQEIAEKNYFIPEQAGDARAWWKELFEHCLGSCRHRVGSTYAEIFYEVIQKYPAWKERVDVLDIDHNHMRLEMCDDKNNWLQVDLGGADGNVTYKEESVDEQLDITELDEEDFVETKEKISVTAEEQKILEVWKSKIAAKKIHTLDDFLKCTLLQSEHTKILCATYNVDALDTQAYFLLAQAASQGRLVFYIDHPSKIDISFEEAGKERVFLNAREEPELIARSMLRTFVVQAQAEKIPPMLLINWHAFSTEARLKLNALLDKKRMLCGTPIPSQLQVIGLCVSFPEDPSFVFRHGARLHTAHIDTAMIGSPVEQKEEEKISIDLQGFSNWEETLFGAIVQTAHNKNNMYWEKSAFVEHVEKLQTPAHIDILHASDPAALSYCIEKARAVGHFLYCGRAIPFPKNIHITCSRAAFDFAVFDPISVRTSFTLCQAASDLHIVNTHRFDFLLVDKKITSTLVPCLGGLSVKRIGVYQKMPGCIPSHAGITLRLCITSSLTTAQWYCLCAEVKKYQVRLELSLAPQVILPAGLQHHFLPAEEKKERLEAVQHAVYITDQPDKVVKKIHMLSASRSVKPLVLHVEDYSFGDLFFSVEYEKKEGRFENFRVRRSAVLDELVAGRDVVLRGNFSESILAELQPFLLGQPVVLPTGESLFLAGKLTCIIELNPKLHLDWLSPPLLQDANAYVRDVEVAPKKKGEMIYVDLPEAVKAEEISEAQIDLENSQAKSAAFIENRKKVLLKTLQTHSIVQMISESGTGKSRLLAEIKREGIAAVYHDFDELDAWASDTSAKDKILFLDEVNMLDMHLTLFAPLKEGGLQRIAYKGKIYQLDAHHKIVCACNEKNYGGGRVEQKLFQDASIPKIYFSDFSDAYIYEEIIKPILDIEGVERSAFIDKEELQIEQEYKALGQFLIWRYKQAKKELGSCTVRELQEYVLQSCEKMRKAFYTYAPVEEKKETFDRFLVTPGNTPILDALHTFIHIRKNAQLQGQDLNGMGLNGFLLEGKPATGKSEIIGYALQQFDYQIVHSLQEAVTVTHPFLCYKISTYLPLAEKECMIIHAFENGHAIWIDELNGCISDGLERILNAVLTGEHPKTKGKPKKSGCMAFFTANSAGLEGRAFIGKAIRHRCTQCATKAYQLEDLTLIFAEKFPAYAEEVRINMAHAFLFLQTQGYDLRTYLEVLRLEIEEENTWEQRYAAASTDMSSTFSMRFIQTLHLANPDFIRNDKSSSIPQAVGQKTLVPTVLRGNVYADESRSYSA